MKTTKNKNRIRLAAPALHTRADAEAILNEIAAITINRNRTALSLDKIIAGLREKYDAQINAYNESLELKTEQLRAWADANPEEFKGKKSLDLGNGQLGWRIGQPQLKTLSGWTWDRVLERLKTLGQSDYIRTKEEIDKQALLASRDTVNLSELGCKAIQSETFFVEPKLTEQENRQTTTQQTPATN